ncbi:MAG: lysine-2,3-aminomutase-like protein [Alphaproteobacteria bacterium]|nr:lysine-2,3-aminomutase-like protein [Alphaproteobacteria bacterium]
MTVNAPRARPLRSVDDLVDAGLLQLSRKADLEAVAKHYAISITPAMQALIDPAREGDPIARQFVPDVRELDHRGNELADPIGDKKHSPVEGIVHRYRDRVLLKIVSHCAVYCRFCFRREMVGPQGEGALSQAALDAALAYIAEHPEIWEVIMTGGDPFMLPARRAAAVTERLAAIDHVKILRWHTRVPVVDPERVTDDFVRAIKAPGKATYVALHANHPREFTPAARAACARLVDAGVAMVSQSVLLKGVNDNPDTLEALMRAFVEARVKPYYLHHADLAPGTEHFRTTIEHGQGLIRELKRRASGLAQPTYALDIPGGYAKADLGAPDIERASTCYRVRDDAGEWHDYKG